MSELLVQLRPYAGELNADRCVGKVQLWFVRLFEAVRTAYVRATLAGVEQPDVRDSCAGFARWWRTSLMVRGLRQTVGRRRIEQAIENLIVRMARENTTWGYDRIVGGFRETEAGYLYPGGCPVVVLAALTLRRIGRFAQATTSIES